VIQGSFIEIFKSQIPIVEKALETASLMLGVQKSRGPGKAGKGRWIENGDAKGHLLAPNLN
jgi:hypothetical protein